ncbi:MAG: YceI family protein [Hyphomonadaceae bacterium]|nr:YceI family protein [Hyphomonadaceae bacterium]
MKWLGVAAMAAFIAGSCSQKDEPLVSDTLAAATAPAASTAWVSAAPVSATAPAPSIEGIPAGDYKLDPTHSTLFFKISHLGFSNFTLWFDTFGADLKLDPANPSAATLMATIDPASLMVHAPPGGFQDELRGEKFVDAKQFPAITFKSTAVTMTGPNTADITGDLTFRGITKPITLSAIYNGGYEGHAYEPQARIGFSAKGVFKRSDFGLDYGLPAEGSNMGASDDIHVVIESEFLGPPMKNPPVPPPAN